MKKRTPFLDMYKKFKRDGKIDNCGLCSCIYIRIKAGTMTEKEGEIFDLFNPTVEDFDKLRESGLSAIYWASDVSAFDDTNFRMWRFSETRQNILLFCAAMNDEI